MYSDTLTRIRNNLDAWEESIKNPIVAQENLLQSLLEDYSKTDYGILYGADDSLSIEEYRERFPAVKYRDILPWLTRVKSGEPRAFLSEKPEVWVMTRGTTGESKVLPATDKHLKDLFRCGSRAVLNFSMNNGGLELLKGGVLNLQFPSNIAIMEAGGKEVVYGFSSGTYARLNPMMMGLNLLPLQDEIDALETGLSRADWETRYEYIYQRARNEEVVTTIGVAPVQTGFARYLKKRHGLFPKDLWKMKAIYTTSVPKIQTKYKGLLNKMYGNAQIIEMYTATEGAFGQQIDEFPYWAPNYDTYLFEVKIGGKFKMLHELNRGQWGKLVISTTMLPRYEIGDLVEAMGKYYYKVFGRDRFLVYLEHLTYRALFKWFI